MVNVTERARSQLKLVLSAKTSNPKAGFRLISKEGGRLSLILDAEKLGDQVLKQDDSKILMVENGLAIVLTGVTIDVRDTPGGVELVFKRPKVK